MVKYIQRNLFWLLMLLLLWVAVIVLGRVIDLSPAANPDEVLEGVHYRHLDKPLAILQPNGYVITSYSWTPQGINRLKSVSEDTVLIYENQTVTEEPYDGAVERVLVIPQVGANIGDKNFRLPTDGDFKMTESDKAPYMYEGTFEEITLYVSFLRMIGFKEISVESTSEVVDMFVQRDDMHLRVIVTQNTLHLFFIGESTKNKVSL